MNHELMAQVPFEPARVLLLFQSQQYEEAINYLSPKEPSDPGNMQLLGFLAYAHQMNENYTAAGTYYNRMLRLDTNNIAALQYISRDDNLKDEEALHFSRRLVALQPKKPFYNKQLADLLRRTMHKDSALLYYRQAYELSPADYRYVAAYAEMLLDQKQTPKADSLLEAGLLKDSLNISYLILRIRSAYEAKDYSKVLVPGERLIRTGEKVLNPFIKLALSYYNLKQYHDCIRVCDFLFSIGFEVESVYYYQAMSWAKLGDFKKSNALLERCLAMAISPTAEMYYYNLAENYEATSQFKKSVSYYDSAYYLFKNPLMVYNAGRILETSIKNEKLANTYYSKYLKNARPLSVEEKKVYEYVKSRILKKQQGTRR